MRDPFQKLLTRVLFLATILTVSGALVSAQRNDRPTSSIEPPFFLLDRQPGQPLWEPLLRLRKAESTYRDTEWWNGYTQLRAWEEAHLGNHGEALRIWDAGTKAPDSHSSDPLPRGVKAANAFDILAQVANRARVIMINERHHAASDRLLTLRLLPVLYGKGFRYFSAEAISERDSKLNERPYPVEGLTTVGSYTQEPVYAEMIREARRLGFTIVPYEMSAAQGRGGPASGESRDQFRDRIQASNLYRRIFRKDPNARVLVHAGYSHVEESVRDVPHNWKKMAMFFRELTGIDPFTVDQTILSERSSPAYEQGSYRKAISRGLLTSQPVVLLDKNGHYFRPIQYSVDLQVLTPRTTYTMNRPDWMTLDGRRVAVRIKTPECQRQRCFIEVRKMNEPANAVPLDRTEAVQTGLVRLFVPPEEDVKINIFSAEGALLRGFRFASNEAGKEESPPGTGQ